MSAVIVGAKGGAGSQHTPVETPDSLHSVQRARIIDAISEGPIKGFAHGGTNPLLDVYLNETPVANADGSLNFANVEIDSRKGTQDQEPMAQFSNVENEIGVGVELRYGTPWTQSITDLDLTALRLHLAVEQLQQSDTSTGDIKGYAIQYKIELATDGGAFDELETSTISGKTTTEYVKTHWIELPAATVTGWVIRVTRLTANADSATTADATTIKSYTEIVDAKLRYPNTALVGIVIDAKQFSSIPSRAYDIYGRVISVPSNYDPVTRGYTGTWDGSFKPAWSDNPAWIFYDLVTHPRYGLGQWISAAKVDKWGLYQIAQYCDELVPDGKGGEEPRFTCNHYIQTQADAYKVLADLTSIFRGMAFWAGGTIQSTADMPGDPEFVYTNANVVDGRFTYQGSDRKTRFTVALVSWTDPNDFYRAKVAYVPDREGIARYGVRETRLIATGATSEGQAQRAGLHALLTSRLETEVVTFEVGQDGHLVAPGKLARIADAKRAKNRQGGRIHSATTTAITVDKEPGIIEIGGSLTVMLPSGVSETRTISAINGRDITVGSAFSEPPLAESAWVAEASTLAAQTVRILSVAQAPSSGEDSLKFTVTALQHNASKFDAIDFGAMIVTPPTVPIDSGYLPPPAVVSVTSYARKGATRAIPVLAIGWPRVAGATKYLVQYRRDNGEWSTVHEVTGSRLEVPNIQPGEYVAQVAAANKLAESTPTVSAPYDLDDSALTPTIVDDLQQQVQDAQADATAAMAEIANFSQDGVLVPTEKKRLIVDYNVITTEQPGIDAQATAYGITTEKTAYDGAVSALASYLGTIPTWNDITVDTSIVRTTFNSKWQTVYTARQALLNAIYAAAKAKADAAQGTANSAQTAAANAQTAANNAQADATSSLNQLADIASDSKLTASEKVQAKQDYLTVTGEQSGIDAQATAYGITTEKTTYDNAITTLKNYLKTTVGVLDASYNWTVITGTTAITRTTWDSSWTAVYNSRQALLNKIAASAKLIADAAQSTANGKNTSYVTTNGVAPVAPTGGFVTGDLWVDVLSGTTWRWSGSAWADKIGDVTAAQTLVGVVNPGFEQRIVGWAPDGTDGLGAGTGWTGESGGSGPNSGSSNYAVHFGGAGTEALRNSARAPVYTGQVFKASARVRGVSANGRCCVRLSWRDSADGEISYTDGTSAPTNSTGSSYALGRAPAGAAFVHVELAVYGHTTGAYRCDDVAWQYQPASVDEVPDGSTYSRSVGLSASEVVDNANFELPPDADGHIPGWDVLGTPVTLTVDASVVYQGSQSLKITGGGGATNFGVISQRKYACSAGDKVFVSAALYSSTGQKMALKIAFFSATGAEVNNAQAMQASYSAWQVVTVSATAGTGAIYYQVSAYNANTNGGVGYVDAVRVSRVRSLDNEVADGSIYGRTAQADLYVSGGVNRVGLRIPGSGHQLGGQRNMPYVTWGNYGGMWSGLSLTYSTTTTSCTFSASSGSYVGGDDSVAYSASSVTVSGTAGSTVIYYLYYDDPAMTGGSKSLQATTSQLTSLNANGRVLVNQVTVTYPTSGTGSGGGDVGCPQVDEPVTRRAADGSQEIVRAGDVGVDDYLLSPSGRWVRVSYSQAKLQQCVRVVWEDGSSRVFSVSAPLEDATGRPVLAPHAKGRVLRHRAAGRMRVADVREEGSQWVQHITAENDYFWVGDFSHHNRKPLT